MNAVEQHTEKVARLYYDRARLINMLHAVTLHARSLANAGRLDQYELVMEPMERATALLREIQQEETTQ